MRSWGGAEAGCTGCISKTNGTLQFTKPFRPILSSYMDRYRESKNKCRKKRLGGWKVLGGPGIFFVNTLLLSHTLETVSVTEPRVRAPTCASISYPFYRVL